MSRVLVIGDTHWGHKNILRYRPEFSSVKNHDEYIISRILRECEKRDTLWLLGDCFFDHDSLKWIDILKERIQYLHFMIGNHDTDSKEKQDVVRQVINHPSISKIGSLVKYKKKFWLSHHPMHVDELFGLKNVHGHVHTHTIEDERFLNVSCENTGYRPVDIMNLEKCPEKYLVDYGHRKNYRGGL